MRLQNGTVDNSFYNEIINRRQQKIAKKPMSTQIPTQTPIPGPTARIPGLANENQDFLPEAEISLLDILRFLKGAYKTILIVGAIGLAVSIAHLALTPKQYEAIAQIFMTQISTVNNNLNPPPVRQYS